MDPAAIRSIRTAHADARTGPRAATPGDSRGSTRPSQGACRSPRQGCWLQSPLRLTQPPDPSEKATGLQNPIELSASAGIKRGSAPCSGRALSQSGKAESVRRQPRGFSSCSRLRRCRPQLCCCTVVSRRGRRTPCGFGVARDCAGAHRSGSIPHPASSPGMWIDVVSRLGVSRHQLQQPGSRTICTWRSRPAAGMELPRATCMLLAPAFRALCWAPCQPFAPWSCSSRSDVRALLARFAVPAEKTDRDPPPR